MIRSNLIVQIKTPALSERRKLAFWYFGKLIFVIERDAWIVKGFVEGNINMAFKFDKSGIIYEGHEAIKEAILKALNDYSLTGAVEFLTKCRITVVIHKFGEPPIDAVLSEEYDDSIDKGISLMKKYLQQI